MVSSSTLGKHAEASDAYPSDGRLTLAEIFDMVRSTIEGLFQLNGLQEREVQLRIMRDQARVETDAHSAMPSEKTIEQSVSTVPPYAPADEVLEAALLHFGYRLIVSGLAKFPGCTSKPVTSPDSLPKRIAKTTGDNCHWPPIGFECGFNQR